MELLVNDHFKLSSDAKNHAVTQTRVYIAAILSDVAYTCRLTGYMLAYINQV